MKDRLNALAGALAVLLVVSGCAPPQTGVLVEACEQPEADRCIAVACDGELGECGVFLCSDVEIVEAVAVEPAQFRPPPPSRRPPPRGPNSWRHTGIRNGARPRAVVPHFAYRFGYLPAFPVLEGKLVRHHWFPQAEEFALFFRQYDINVHQYTMLIPEPIHLRIHAGSRGGPWNDAWRRYICVSTRIARISRKRISCATRLTFPFASRWRVQSCPTVDPWFHLQVLNSSPVRRHHPW